MATWAVGDGLCWAVNGPHIASSQRGKNCFSFQKTQVRALSKCPSFSQNNWMEFRCKKLGSAAQALVRGMHELKGRPVAGSTLGFSRSLQSLQLRGAYIMTEQTVGGRLRSSKESGKRRLILLRHAKSSWSDRSLKDHDRPLSKRGRLAAAHIANKLKHEGWLPDLILCSDSLRTRETLHIMQTHARDLRDVEVHFLGSFYAIAAMDGHTAQHLQDNICKYSHDAMTTIMCMGHNRGWEEAASLLCGVPIELKTANAALLEAPGASWQEAFELAGNGGWKLCGIMKPDAADVEKGVL